MKEKDKSLLIYLILHQNIELKREFGLRKFIKDKKLGLILQELAFLGSVLDGSFRCVVFGVGDPA